MPALFDNSPLHEYDPDMPSRIALHAICLLTVSSFLTGCSQNVSPPSTVPVSGKVLFKGKPIAGVRVTMHPLFSMGKIEWGVVGETGPTGAFTMGTGLPGNGAPPGDYIVTFTKPSIASDPERNGIEMEVDDFRGKYSDPDASSWNVTVIKGDDNVLDPFELE